MIQSIERFYQFYENALCDTIFVSSKGAMIASTVPRQKWKPNWLNQTVYRKSCGCTTCFPGVRISLAVGQFVAPLGICWVTLFIDCNVFGHFDKICVYNFIKSTLKQFCLLSCFSPLNFFQIFATRTKEVTTEITSFVTIHLLVLIIWETETFANFWMRFWLFFQLFLNLFVTWSC